MRCGSHLGQSRLTAPEKVRCGTDDTGLILDAVLEHGPDSPTGRSVIRRMNQRHRSYDISDDDRFHDAYEAEHFGHSAGGRVVAEATLGLLGTFPPHDRLPATVVHQTSFALMDDALLDAFRFLRPNPVLAAATRAGLRAHGRALRFARPPAEPFHARQLPTIRSYPDGSEVAALGTFPSGCPVPHGERVAAG